MFQDLKIRYPYFRKLPNGEPRSWSTEGLIAYTYSKLELYGVIHRGWNISDLIRNSISTYPSLDIWFI